MIRLADARDVATIEALLADHPETTMFLRANLARLSLGGGRFWLSEAGVFSLSADGYGMVHVGPEFDWAALAALLRGKRCVGINGSPEQVAAARNGLGLSQVVGELDRTEPLLALRLDDLTVPPDETELRPMTEADIALITRWRAAYLCEIMGTTPGAATDATAERQVRRSLAGGHVRVLMHRADPVAMTAFNAALPDMVQVGSVYTPPDLRCRGHARRAVALHLCEARARGVTRAVLFSASSHAARAYKAIGFRQIGDYHLLNFASPVVIGA